MQQPYIVGIRFQKVGKIYHFDASAMPDLQPGDFAVVETARGTQLGEVIQIVNDPPRPPEGFWKPVQRRATPRDLVLRQLWQRRELEVTINCRAKAAELKITDVKIVASEFSFDGSRLYLIYSTEEGNEKVDLRALKRAMQRDYPQTQIETHQVGPRDVAKLIGGMGACGLGSRCCSTFLTDFSPVSIKMAKEQGISLTPTEITGMCGRLRCCLVYEYEQYVEARKQLPKRNKRVVTPAGEGRVWDVLPLQDAVIVELENGARQTFQRVDIQPWDELEALKQKSQSPCGKHPDGNCSCNRHTPEDASETPVAEVPALPEAEPAPQESKPFLPPARPPAAEVKPAPREAPASPPSNAARSKGSHRRAERPSRPADAPTQSAEAPNRRGRPPAARSRPSGAQQKEPAAPPVAPSKGSSAGTPAAGKPDNTQRGRPPRQRRAERPHPPKAQTGNKSGSGHADE